MIKSNEIKVTESDGNVFADLGFEDAGELLIRADTWAVLSVLY